MKIAVFHNLPSGGAKRTLCESVRRMSTRHQIDVYALSSANHTFADLRPYVSRHQVYPFQPGRLFESPFGRLNQIVRLRDLMRIKGVTRQIAQEIEQSHYDLAYVEPCQFEIAPSVLRYLQGRVPTVYYCQEPLRRLYEKMPARPYDRLDSGRQQKLDRIDPFPALYHRVLKENDRRNTCSASRVLVNSAFMRAAVGQVYGIDPTVSYHGIDAQMFRPLPIEKQPMLLSVGSLTPLKGFDFLIQAISRLPREARLPLTIASNFQNPPEREYLTALARDLQVELSLLANITDSRLVELYNQARLTLYAAVREPLGLVPLESMACGTPVVAVREGGVQETVLHERTGLLVERDAEQFAQALRRLLADAPLRAEYGRSGRQHVLEHWTWDRAVDTLEHDLMSVMK
jgi:glycosyltransferase involved in cell wall biosynthesis